MPEVCNAQDKEALRGGKKTRRSEFKSLEQPISMQPENRGRRLSTKGDSNVKRVKVNEPSYAFLETINRKKLDFDAEKACSVTLSTLNVYCCIVCGKYLQGRRANSPAFLHSVNDNHHVFVDFKTLKFYLLPDGIEIEDNGRIQLLNSIRYAIGPQFTKNEISQFPTECQDLNNNTYFNGFIGVNNSARNKSVNVVLLALAHLRPLRDYCLLAKIDQEDEFTRRLALFIRKIWSVKLFKQHVSVDEFLAFVTVNDKRSAKNLNDPRKCLLWLLDCIQTSAPKLKYILSEACQGKVLVTKTGVKVIYDEDENVKDFTREKSSKSTSVPFWSLTLDLPPRPLFKGKINVNDLPQVRLEDLMCKFNGIKEKQMSHHIMQYKILKLPKYLVLHFDRFDRADAQPVKNRNHTLVEFPLTMKVEGSTYKLLANIVHQVSRTAGTTRVEKDDQSNWIIQLYNSAIDQWVEIDGSNVRTKDKELLFLNEIYIQIWELETA